MAELKNILETAEKESEMKYNALQQKYTKLSVSVQTRANSFQHVNNWVWESLLVELIATLYTKYFHLMIPFLTTIFTTFTLICYL